MGPKIVVKLLLLSLEKFLMFLRFLFITRRRRLRWLNFKAMCMNCTFINSVHNHSCVVCEFGWTGRRECPADKWECLGCTFYNPKVQFYCEICNKARSDLASVRF